MFTAGVRVWELRGEEGRLMSKQVDKWLSLRTDFFGQDAHQLGMLDLSPRAFLAFIASISWAARQGTDYTHRGIIRMAIGPRVQPAIDELVDMGFLVPRIGQKNEWHLAHEGTLWRRGTPLQRRPIRDHVRRTVMERDGHACVECSATEALTLDHIWPYSKGGTDEPANLRVLCRSCNSKKGARTYGS